VREDLDQTLTVARARPQVGGRVRQFEVAADGHQASRQRQEVEGAAQILPDHATDVGGGGDHPVERTVLREPLDGRLGADLVDAGNVVDGVADQRQVIDDTLRRHAELAEHAGFVEHLVAHRVDQADVRADQLREILVTGRHHHLHALRRRLRRQRTDHVVRLDAVAHQQRPAEGHDGRVQGFDLTHHVLGHRRAVRLVLRVPVVTKGPSLGVEDAALVVDSRRLVIAFQAPQHVQHAVDRSGGLVLRGTQVGHGMEGAVEVRRSVDQQQGGHRRATQF
jgi:hypothetical protein